MKVSVGILMNTTDFLQKGCFVESVNSRNY